MFRPQDLPIFFRDFGDAITFNGVSTYSNGTPVKGTFDQRTDMFTSHGPGGFETDELVLTFPRTAFSPLPHPQDLITVAGVVYVIKAPCKSMDASLCSYYLKTTS